VTDKARLPVRGAGGGSGGGAARTPVESLDSLRSRQYARVIDVIGEGEIAGLVDGMKSIYLDDVPLQNPDGTFNFSGVVVQTRSGTQNQLPVEGFPAVESEIAVAVAVKYASPVVRTLTNPNTNAARVTIRLPALMFQSDNGDLGGSSVDIAIDVQNAGAGWQQRVADTISGKTTAGYKREYRLSLPPGGPWDIRVRRLTQDSTDSNLRNETYWDSYTEIVEAKLAYPNSALVALQIDAEQFQRIPARGYCFVCVSVFDHWLTEDEGSSCNIMTFNLAMKANAEAAYFEGEHRFLDFYLAAASDGVLCNRPFHGKILSKDNPRLKPMLLDSLREKKLMDVYFKSLRARVIGGWDRTDLILTRNQSDLERVQIAAKNSCLCLLP
jgi:hypothetical protein